MFYNSFIFNYIFQLIFILFLATTKCFECFICNTNINDYWCFMLFFKQLDTYYTLNYWWIIIVLFSSCVPLINEKYTDLEWDKGNQTITYFSINEWAILVRTVKAVTFLSEPYLQWIQQIFFSAQAKFMKQKLFFGASYGYSWTTELTWKVWQCFWSLFWTFWTTFAMDTVICLFSSS